MCPRVYHFKQLHDVWVVQASQNIDLSVNGHQLTLSRQKFLLVGLESYLIPCLSVCCFLYYGKCAFADDLVDFEVFLQVEDRVLFFPF